MAGGIDPEEISFKGKLICNVQLQSSTYIICSRESNSKKVKHKLLNSNLMIIKYHGNGKINMPNLLCWFVKE